jgi:virginiamycin B lyase
VTEAGMVRPSARAWFRLGVVSASVAAAVLGSVLLATRDSEDKATTRGITATLQVSQHPGWLVAGRDAVWLALNHDPKRPLGEMPLVRLELATGLVELKVAIGGEASYLRRVGNRVIASVRHRGQDEFGGRLLLALDWRSGGVLVRRAFDAPVDHVVPVGSDLWALEDRPGALLRLDVKTLAPTAPRLRLSTGRTLDLAVGAGYIWVTSADTGEVLRIDPATRAVTRVHVGGSPVGIAVAGGRVWYTDPERGTVSYLEDGSLHPSGRVVHAGGRPTWLATAGAYLFVSNADDGTVSRIDVRSGTRAGLPIRIATPANEAVPFAMSSSGNSVWVSSFESNAITRISSASSPAPSRTILASDFEPAEGAAGALPRGGKIVARIPIPEGKGSLAVGEGAVWVFSNDSSELLRIDPAKNSIVARIEILETSGDAAAGAGAVWISHPATDKVSRVDPATNKVAATIHVGPEPAGLAVSHGAVWVANIGGPSVSRIDPATNRVVRTIRVGPASACCSEHMSVTARDDAVWVEVPNANTIVRIDPATDQVTNVVKVPYSPCAFLAADEDAVWNAGGGCGDFLARIDARTRKLTTTLQGEPHPVGLALYDGSLWVAALQAQSVDRVDPETGRLKARLPTGGSPLLLGVGFGAVWVFDDMGGGVLRIEPQD